MPVLKFLAEKLDNSSIQFKTYEKFQYKEIIFPSCKCSVVWLHLLAIDCFLCCLSTPPKYFSLSLSYIVKRESHREKRQKVERKCPSISSLPKPSVSMHELGKVRR